MAERSALTRALGAVALVVGLAAPGFVGTALAQPAQDVADILGAKANRDLTKSCFGNRGGSCRKKAESLWGEIKSWVSDALAAPVEAAPRCGECEKKRPPVLDGTFYHADAPVFYTLKGLVPGSSAAVCQVVLAKITAQEFQRLVCVAEGELACAPPTLAKNHLEELKTIRSHFETCLRQ